MLPPKIAALCGEMEKVRGETLSSVTGLTDEEFSRRVGGEWSAAQIPGRQASPTHFSGT